MPPNWKITHMRSKTVSSSAPDPAVIAPNGGTAYWWALSCFVAVLVAIMGLAYAVY